MKDLNDKALKYHKKGRSGKIEVVPSKSCKTSGDLSFAYTPGVAAPVLEIDKDNEAAYTYTAKGNLVAVISNGTAILGLGDRGALASKPVMEGKGVLFKRFADIDVFDIELDLKDPEKIVEVVKSMEPTFGGINLEDIKAPECFYIEEELKKRCSIPVFHDDQHGTAIIAGAGLLNALEIVGKKIDEVKVVFNGAGAAGCSVAHFFMTLGVKKENLVVCDKDGVLYRGRAGELSDRQRALESDTDFRTLEEAVCGADVLVGVSVKDCVTPVMLKSMAGNPIVFAMANPDPEISYDLARSARKDLIMATGRSDYPNQINNVLGFPFIFRGALDVRATAITEKMKRAAALALAALAKEPVPKAVQKAYGGKKFSFGPDYIVPKPFDPRVIEWEAVAVAQAACEEGVAARPISDWGAYRKSLRKRMKKLNKRLV